MVTLNFEGHYGRSVVIDLCHECQAFWFDGYESLELSPASVLELFQLIGRTSGRVKGPLSGLAQCPKCAARLLVTKDQQRSTKFEYRECPERHGRLITFFNFLREKDFIRPMSPAQIDELRRNVRSVNCSNCGAPIDLAKGSACAHCGSPLSMLDVKQAEALVARLRDAATTPKRISPTLPIDLLRASHDVRAAFDAFDKDRSWFDRIDEKGVVTASVRAFVDWMSKP
jgi:hypothetical protein